MHYKSDGSSVDERISAFVQRFFWSRVDHEMTRGFEPVCRIDVKVESGPALQNGDFVGRLGALERSSSSLPQAGSAGRG